MSKKRTIYSTLHDVVQDQQPQHEVENVTEDVVVRDPQPQANDDNHKGDFPTVENEEKKNYISNSVEVKLLSFRD